MHFSRGAFLPQIWFETSVIGPFREGAPITWSFYLEDGPFVVENYFLSVEIHEEALRAAGYRNVRWYQPMLSPEGDSAHGGLPHDLFKTDLVRREKVELWDLATHTAALLRRGLATL